MSRVTTKTGVANLANSLLKTDAVTNIDPPDADSKPAKLASRWYEDTRREVLAEHNWDFAIKRVQVSASAAPVFGPYAYKYQLPSDYIRVATLGDEQNPETEYEVEDGFILCNVPAPLNLRYVYDFETVTQFSPKFLTAFVTKLAAHMAYELTGNRSMVAEMEAAYDKMLSTAQTLDGQQNPPKRVQRSRWTAAKHRGHIDRFY
jgi:hypothetical protein